MTELIQSSRDGRLLKLTLNRPEKRNALTTALCADLTAALVEAEHDPDITAILLTGNGKVFCAGMDLMEALTGDGGMIAATLPAMQKWKSGNLSDSAFWHQCFFDPPELGGGSGGASASQ